MSNIFVLYQNFWEKFKIAHLIAANTYQYKLDNIIY